MKTLEMRENRRKIKKGIIMLYILVCFCELKSISYLCYKIFNKKLMFFDPYV